MTAPVSKVRLDKVPSEVEEQIPQGERRVFTGLPSVNAFFDIRNAIKYVIPLNMSYSNSLRSTTLKGEKDHKVEVIEKAYALLMHRQEELFVTCFHRLAEEFLKEYRKYFANKQIEALVSPRGHRPEESKKNHMDSPRVRDAILKQEVTVYAYFDNFFTLSERYLECVAEDDEKAKQAAVKGKKGK